MIPFPQKLNDIGVISTTHKLQQTDNSSPPSPGQPRPYHFISITTAGALLTNNNEYQHYNYGEILVLD
jgi:hypothetical protein